MYHPRYHPWKNGYLVIFLWYLCLHSFFEQEQLLTSSILIYNAIDKQLSGVHRQKTQVYLKSMAIKFTTPTSQSVNTGPSPWSPSTCPFSLQIHQVILIKYYILYPVVQTSTIYFLLTVLTTRLCTYTSLFYKINQSSLVQNRLLPFESPAPAYHLNKFIKSFNIPSSLESFILIFLSILCSCGPLKYSCFTINIYLTLIHPHLLLFTHAASTYQHTYFVTVL